MYIYIYIHFAFFIPGSIALNVDTDLEKWEEDWGAAGWFEII